MRRIVVPAAGNTASNEAVKFCPRAQYEAYLSGVDCSAATARTAVGSYTPGTEGGPTMAERWNGASWTRQDSATPSADTAQLNSVSCPASRVCIAVGDSGTHSLLAERWDGSAWALTPHPVNRQAQQAVPRAGVRGKNR